MKARSGKESVWEKIVRPLTVGTAVGVAACVVALLLMAGLMAAGTFPSRAVTLLALAAAGLGALVGGFVAARISRERGLLFGAGSGLFLFLLTLAAGLFLSPAGEMGLWLVKLAVTVVAGAVGGLLAVNTRRR